MKVILTARYTLALALVVAWCASSSAQEPAKNTDAALDSLIKELASGDHKNESPTTEPTKPEKGSQNEVGSKLAGSGSGKVPDPTEKRETGQPGKSTEIQRPGSAEVTSKDKELDELLEKLGEAKDEPATEARPREQQHPAENPDPSKSEKKGAEENKEKERAPGLQSKDKDLDERLEEMTGRKKKQRSEREEGTGPLGQIIKEMRDVEQRLGKPDTGEDTQSKERRIVKQLSTLIEQMRQSSSPAGMMAIRRAWQPGQRLGSQPGQTPGAMGGQAPRSQPAKPKDQRSLAGGKEVWGHLPPELRQEMENVFKEEALPTKQDLIRRYYQSVAQRKLVRGE
jgi:hypothetical protein